MRRPLASVFCKNRGVAAVEFAILSPIAFLTLLGIVEFGRLLWTQATLGYAVQAAARCAAIDPITCNGAAAIQSYGVNKAPGVPVSAGNFSYAVQPCGARVSVTYSFAFVVPLMLPYAPTLTAQACYPR